MTSDTRDRRYYLSKIAVHRIRFSLLLLFAVCIFTISPFAYATDYVLPYPSYMPGHRLYRLHQLWEKAMEYWHFGNIAKFKYHLKMSDKYLVEAKTLFEYKQYLLAIAALGKSDNHFQKVKVYLVKAEKEGKDISQKQDIYQQAKKKHKEVLAFLIDDLPRKVIWEEENNSPIELDLYKALMTTITNVR